MKRKREVKLSEDSEPFPDLQRPAPEECLAVRNLLLEEHGFPQQFAKYRRRSSDDGEGGGGERESVLDGLISTLLSQNTTESNSQRSFALLKSAFPTWDLALAAEQRCIEDAIRCGGLAPKKASCIKNILKSLLEKRGKLCLEYLRDMSIDDVKSELSNFKGIGPKTAACVLMFHLQQDDFPVDTHILQIAKAIGWVPPSASSEKAYLHLNKRIPNELKFDLNCLLYTHGKLCQGCAFRGDKHERTRKLASCPLMKYIKDHED